MCATYFVDDGTAIEMLEVINALNQKFGYETVTYDQIYPNGEPAPGDVYPKNTAPVGAFKDEQVTVMTPVWGFPVKTGGKVSFNARAENVRKYGIWREAYAAGRAFAPAQGFYESKRLPDSKSERYYFTNPDGKLLFMAALLETTHDKGGKPCEVFTIITTEANDSVSDIHDRMPLLLEQDKLVLWLTDQNYADSLLTRPGPRLISVRRPVQKRKNEAEQLSLFDRCCDEG